MTFYPLPIKHMRLTFLAILALPLATSAAVLDLTWNGVSTLWSDGANWNPPGVYPKNTVTDQFNVTVSSSTVRLTENITVNSLLLTGTTLSTAGGNFVLTSLNGATLNGTITHSDSGTLTVAGPISTGSNTAFSGIGTTLGGNTTLGANNLQLKFSGSSLNNTGTININGSGNLDHFNTGATGLVNLSGGIIQIVGDVSGSVTSSLGDGLFLNQGTLIKSGSSAGHTTSLTVPFTNSGAVHVQSGVLRLSAGSSDLGAGTINIASGATLDLNAGTYILNPSMSVTGNGVLRLSGGINSGAVLRTNGDVTLDSSVPLTVAGGRISGPNTTSTFSFPSGLALNGPLRNSNGPVTLLGPITVGAGASFSGVGFTLGSDLNLAANNLQIQVSGSTLNNAATISINGSGNLDHFNTGATGLRNLPGGVVQIVGDVSGSVTSSNGGGEFSNEGTFRKSGSATNHISTVTVPFTNVGTVDAQAGKLSFSSFPTNSGMVKLSASEIVISGTSTFVAGSELSGSGTITTSGLVINGGAVSPGNSAGILNVAGPLTFSNASGINPHLNLELNGIGSAFYDQLIITTNHTLALGAGVTDLNVSLNFNPLLGTTFRILSAAAASGQITGTFHNLPNGGTLDVVNFRGDTYTLQVNYGTKFVDVTVLAVPEPSIYAAFAGLLTLGTTLWRKRQRA